MENDDLIRQKKITEAQLKVRKIMAEFNYAESILLLELLKTDILYAFIRR